MAISWDSFDKIWASTSPLTPYSFSDPNYAQGWNFVGSTPPARQMWDSIQKQNDEKFKYLRDNFGTPNIVTQASQMIDTDKVYVYLGSEAGWNNGHWYYYDEGTSSWADGGVYNSVAFVTDTTLSIAGQPADAKATGDALALKSDLAGCTFTGNVSVNADLSVTGDATIGTDLSVAGDSTLTGNVSASGDIVVVGDVSSANLTTSADATIGGDLSVTGASTLAGNITTSGDISADNISATTNGTVGGNLSVTGTSTLTGNINAGADITVVGDVSADNLTTTTNTTVGGSLSVAGTSTLTGNVTTNGNINAVGDISSANLTTTNATIGGNATVTGDVSCANLTTSADASVGGDLTVTGDSTLADTTVDDLVVNNDLSVAGDSSLTNLSVSGTTALAGTSTAPTPSADDNSTKIATTEYVQTEIKPIETDVTINDKRISNIEKLLQGNLYDYQTDSDSKYVKTVPAGAMPYASLEQIGGKTLVFNQLADSNGTITDENVTHTYVDGIFTIVSTTLSASVKGIMFDISNFVVGHKYLVIADCMVDDANYYAWPALSKPDGGSALTNETVVRPATADSFSRCYSIGTLSTMPRAFCVRTKNDTPSGTGFKAKNIQAFDLTLLYGSGNEPSTVAEFESMFPASYYPYNAGTLLSAGVTSVVSVGKNLFDKTTVQSGYISDNTGNVVASATSICTDYIGINPTLKYYIKSDAPNGRYGAWYDYNKQFISGATGIGEKTPPSNAQYIRFTVSFNGNGDVDTFCINVSNVSYNGNYYPYNAHTYPIPAEIQALEGYGWSAGSVYNYVDYERKVFVKNVGAYTFDGTETWYATGGGQPFYVSTLLPDALYGANKWCATNRYGINNSAGGTGYSDTDKKAWLIDSTSYKRFYVRDTAYNSSTIGAGMVGLTVYYPLATPQEIDISAYLTDDNLIEVEAGGTLTFPNSNGTDYQIPVPSAETYMVDLQSAI